MILLTEILLHIMSPSKPFNFCLQYFPMSWIVSEIFGGIDLNGAVCNYTVIM